MHSRSESCLGILLRNHIMEPTLVICHNVNGDHQLGCGLSSLLYNHCALFFSFTTISNLWGDTLRPCKCPAAYPLMRFSINWWFLLDLMFIMVVTIYVCVCVYIYICLSYAIYPSIIYLSFTDTNLWIVIFSVVYNTFLYLIIWLLKLSQLLPKGALRATSYVFVMCPNHFLFLWALSYFLA